MAKKTANNAPPPKAENPLKQTCTFRAPGALSVLLVGDFTDRQKQPIPLQTRGDGLWAVEVEVAPGTHHYRFLVDGEWRDDPECAVRVPNIFGSQDCVCQVGAVEDVKA